jgi:hypothetical protein
MAFNISYKISQLIQNGFVAQSTTIWLQGFLDFHNQFPLPSPDLQAAHQPHCQAGGDNGTLSSSLTLSVLINRRAVEKSE